MHLSHSDHIHRLLRCERLACPRDLRQQACCHCRHRHGPRQLLPAVPSVVDVCLRSGLPGVLGGARQGIFSSFQVDFYFLKRLNFATSTKWCCCSQRELDKPMNRTNTEVPWPHRSSSNLTLPGTCILRACSDDAAFATCPSIHLEEACFSRCAVCTGGIGSARNDALAVCPDSSLGGGQGFLYFMFDILFSLFLGCRIIAPTQIGGIAIFPRYADPPTQRTCSH